MNRRGKQARLLTNGIIGISADTTLGDEHWDDVTLLLAGSSPTDDLSNTNQDTSITNTGGVFSVSLTGPTGYGTVDALRFNETTNQPYTRYLTTSYYSSANLYNQDFTIEGWFNLPTNPYPAPSTNAVLFGHRSADTTHGVTVFVDTVNQDISLVVGDGANWFVLENATGVDFTDGWQHIAVTRENNTYRLFKDGAVIATSTSSNTVAVTGDFVIMASNSSGDDPVPGDVFDFRITEGVARYTQNFTPPTKSLPAKPLGLTVPVEGDDFWDDVTLLLDGSSLTDDLSTAGNDTTDEGAAIVSVTGPYGGTQDVLDFDRTGSTTTTGKFIKTGVTDDFKFGTSPFTIEMWLKPDTLDTSSQSLSLGCICEYDTTAGITGSWFAFHQVNGEVRFYIDNGNTNLTTTSSGLSTSNWSHVAIVRDAANTLTIYVDGTSKAVSSAGAFSHNLSDANSRQLYIGKQPTQLRHYDGKIADLRITKGVARYTQNFTPPTASFLTNAPSTTTTGRRGVGNYDVGDEHWNDVTLLLDGEGSSIEDKSSITSRHTVTAYGPTTSSTQAKFGSKSLAMTNTIGNRITVSNDNSEFSFGTDSFTVEAWVYLTAMPTSNSWPDASWVVGGGPANNNPGFDMAIGSTNIIMSIDNFTSQEISATHGMSTNQWYHVAWVRNGTSLAVYVDGVQKGSATSSATADPCLTGIAIGAAEPSGAIDGNFPGFIDNLRITKGVARYTSDFTLPTESFPTVLAGTPLRTRGYIGTAPAAVEGDDFWNDVSLLIRGHTLTDLSANSHTLTASGNAAAGDTSPVKFASGSLTFDGTGDYVSIPDDTSLDFGSGDFTVELWAYHNGALGTWEAPCGNFPADNSPDGFYFAAENTGKMRFLAGDGSWQVGIVDTENFPINQWVHLAATREDNKFTLWVNGVSRGTTTTSSFSISNNIPFYVGKHAQSGIQSYHYWNGNIEDLRITKGVARYTSDFTPPTASFPNNASQRPVGMLTLYDRYVDTLA